MVVTVEQEHAPSCLIRELHPAPVPPARYRHRMRGPLAGKGEAIGTVLATAVLVAVYAVGNVWAKVRR
jgi:hypothetical protein